MSRDLTFGFGLGIAVSLIVYGAINLTRAAKYGYSLQDNTIPEIARTFCRLAELHGVDGIKDTIYKQLENTARGGRYNEYEGNRLLGKARTALEYAEAKECPQYKILIKGDTAVNLADKELEKQDLDYVK